MSFDPASVRDGFPIFAAFEHPLHYLDNAATSQIHRLALDAVVRHESCARANVQRANYRLAEAASRAYEQARDQVARFVNARSAGEVVFTSGTTAALNLVAYAFGQTLSHGDEIVITAAEHHSNFVPWQRLRDRAGVVLKVLPLTADGRVDLKLLPELVGERCRLISVNHGSNVTGAVPDIDAIVGAARSVGARVLLDGAQRVQHGPVDVEALGVDFYAFSGHKCFAPTGVGVLWGRAELLASMPPFLCGGGMVADVCLATTTFAAPPRRFEAGTPPIAQAVGLGDALEWMRTLDWPAIRAHELALCRRLIDGLRTIPGARIIGPTDSDDRLPVVSFTLDGLHPHDICQVLDDHGVALRGGHHCAQPLLHALGVDAATRASIALYNDGADIDALLAGIDDAIRTLA
jgi:cysteine desulfurase/selenocysteine lyase